jgi:hypothetical protein
MVVLKPYEWEKPAIIHIILSVGLLEFFRHPSVGRLVSREGETSPVLEGRLRLNERGDSFFVDPFTLLSLYFLI